MEAGAAAAATAIYPLHRCKTIHLVPYTFSTLPACLICSSSHPYASSLTLSHTHTHQFSHVHEHHHHITQVRHAQGVHNVEGDTDHSAYMKPDFFDARITPLGWNQVKLATFHFLGPAYN